LRADFGVGEPVEPRLPGLRDAFRSRRKARASGARLRQANRLLAAGDRDLTVDKLTAIEAEDIRQSRVFQQPALSA